MMRDSALTWSWIGILTKRRYDAIIDKYQSLDAALPRVNAQFLRELGCREDTIKTTLDRLNKFDGASYGSELAKRGVDLLSIEDTDYPRLLREIGDPPIFLAYKGDLSILDQPTVALVGTRQMSSYGRRIVERFTPDIVRAGVTTVSGLAAGVDAAVARETLAAGGKTVAVLGHGLAVMYPPSNVKLAEEIVSGGGLLLSEFPLDQIPGKYTFPARNRIIAGLSLATVVLEAPIGSGALITSDLALDYDREVYAVPGQVFDPTFDGCHEIIAKGHAKLATHPRDILLDLGIIVAVNRASESYEPRSEEEAQVFATLTTMPQKIDDVVMRSGLEMSQVNATLTMMELSGVVKNVGAGEWVKT